MIFNLEITIENKKGERGTKLKTNDPAEIKAEIIKQLDEMDLTTTDFIQITVLKQ